MYMIRVNNLFVNKNRALKCSKHNNDFKKIKFYSVIK